MWLCRGVNNHWPDNEQSLGPQKLEQSQGRPPASPCGCTLHRPPPPNSSRNLFHLPHSGNNNLQENKASFNPRFTSATTKLLQSQRWDLIPHQIVKDNKLLLPVFYLSTSKQIYSHHFKVRKEYENKFYVLKYRNGFK